MCKNLVVSLHDVSPFFHEELSEIVGRLYDVGIEKMNLLVVPDWGLNYECAYDLRNNLFFVDWLHKMKKNCEIVQHGCHHKSEKRTYDDPVQYLMGEQVAVGMSEFLLTDYSETKSLIDEGLNILNDVGLHVSGIVPPWWQVTKPGERAIRDSGFDYYMTSSPWNLFGRFSSVPINDLKSGRMHFSRELCFEPRSRFADYFTRLLAYIVTNCEQAETIRFGIHPPDIRNNGVFDYILSSIEKVRSGRELKTYSELLGI